MIIALRGTNGAGKSTLVRAVMKFYDECIPKERPGRRRPLGYYCYTNREIPRQLYIPGHYEIANGGIDTLGSLEDAYSLIAEANAAGYHVLFEGKNMQDGSSIDIATTLFTKEEITFVHVNHPVDDCIASVRQRGHSIKEETIRSIAARVEKNNEVLRREHYACHSLSREDALAKVKELLS